MSNDSTPQIAEAIKPYISGDHASGWDILDHTGKTVKTFHHRDYADHPIPNKKKAAYDDAVSYLNKNFKKLSKPVSEVVELEEAEVYQKDMEKGKPVFAQGVKGMKSTPFVKKFKSQEHYEKWADSDAAGNHEVHRVFQEGVELEEAKGEMSKEQILKKINDGSHEAMTDVVPGKHVELRHVETGKKSMVFVKRMTEEQVEENYGLHKKYYSMSHDELKNAHSKLVSQQTDLIRKAPRSVERDVIDQKIETVRGLLKAHQQKARQMKEGTEKHRVSVTVSEPDHPAVSMRDATKEKFVRITADNKESAVEKAKAHYKKAGYKVHSAEHVGMISEEQIDELSNNLLAAYKKKAGEDASKANAAFNFKKADKRFSGIVKATNKQFDNDAKARAAKMESAETESYDELTEKLAFDATAADYIHDFIKSDAPQFAGKSKAKRMKMALAAFYARQRDQKNEDINTTEEEILDEASSAALSKKASESGVSLSILKKVYARGVAAWNSGHRPGTTPQQWGMARVNSYITKGKGTYHGADKDLREDNYCDGLSDKTCKARYAHWKKMSKKSDKDPSAYQEAPGDKTAETKPSKYTLLYKKLYSKKSV